MGQKATNIPQHQKGVHIDKEPDVKNYFYEKVRKGMNPYQAGELMGIRRSLVRRLLDDMSNQSKEQTPTEVAEALATGEIPSQDENDFPDPKKYEELNKAAQRAHDDFAYFRQRYFNRRHIPW